MDAKRKVHPVQHKIKREIYVNAENEVEFSGEGSIPENVSPKSALNKTQEKRTTSIDQTEKNRSNDCEKTDTFYCNSCGADDCFDCMCSDSENETKSNKKEIDMSPDSRDLDDETKSDQKVIEVKEKDYFCNFNSLSNWSNYPLFYVPELSK